MMKYYLRLKIKFSFEIKNYFNFLLQNKNDI